VLQSESKPPNGRKEEGKKSNEGVMSSGGVELDALNSTLNEGK
jgi:hypothetical protein